MVQHALKWGQKIEQEEAHRNEIAIAQLTSVYANSQKLKPPYTSPADYFHFRPKENGIPSWICNTFFDLSQSGDLPGWVISLAPVSELQRDRNDDPVSRPRLWLMRGIAAIAPRHTAFGLKVGMALIDEDIKPGRYRLWDIDTSEDYLVEVSGFVQSGAYFDLVWEIIEEDDDAIAF